MSLAAWLVLIFAVIILGFVVWRNITPSSDKKDIVQLGPEAPYKLEPPEKSSTSE